MTDDPTPEVEFAHLTGEPAAYRLATFDAVPVHRVTVVIRNQRVRDLGGGEDERILASTTDHGTGTTAGTSEAPRGSVLVSGLLGEAAGLRLDFCRKLALSKSFAAPCSTLRTSWSELLYPLLGRAWGAKETVATEPDGH